MHNSEGKFCSPIGEHEMKSVLGTKGLDAGQICSSTNINKWAKWKPFNLKQKTGAPSRRTAAEAIAGNYGLTVPSAGTAYQAVANTWVYNRVNTDTHWATLTDFENPDTPTTDGTGYNHHAVTPMINENKDFTYYTNSGAAATFSYVILQDGEDGNITMADFASFRNCYLTVAIKRNNVLYLKSAPQTAASGLSTVSVSAVEFNAPHKGVDVSGKDAAFTSGTYDYYLILSTYQFTFLTHAPEGDSETQKFYPSLVDNVEGQHGTIRLETGSAIFSGVVQQIAKSINDTFVDVSTYYHYEDEEETQVYYPCNAQGTLAFKLKVTNTTGAAIYLNGGNLSVSASQTLIQNHHGSGELNSTLTLFNASKQQVTSLVLNSGGDTTFYVQVGNLMNYMDGVLYDRQYLSQIFSNIGFKRSGATFAGTEAYVNFQKA